MNLVDVVRPVGYTWEYSVQLRGARRREHRENHTALKKRRGFQDSEFPVGDSGLKAWWDYGDQGVWTDWELVVPVMKKGAEGGVVRGLGCAYKTNLRKRHERLAGKQTFRSPVHPHRLHNRSSKLFTGKKVREYKSLEIVIQKCINGHKIYFFTCISNHAPVLLNILFFFYFIFYCWQLERVHILEVLWDHARNANALQSLVSLL